MPKKFVVNLPALLLLPALLFSQYASDNDYRPLSSQKSVTDYFDSVDDKSYYQSQRIHGMKREINSYSERLHNLQSRFDEIFFGLSRGNSFRKPFDTDTLPVRPQRKELYAPEAAPQSSFAPSAMSPAVNPDLIDPAEANPANQLAFQVDSPGTYTQGGKTKALFNPNDHGEDGLGKYFLFAPGYAVPYKVHKPSLPITDGQKYRRYDPGPSVVVAGGFRKNGLRFGLGGMYKRHEFHETSYEFHSSYPYPGNRLPLAETSETFAGFLDLGYDASLFGNFEGYLGVGLGYYLSIIKDPRRRSDHGFFATGNLGVAYRFNELIALRLGYRYLHEEEAPSHVGELGLDFEF